MKISLSAILNFTSQGADKVAQKTKEIKDNLTGANKASAGLDKALRGTANSPFKDQGLDKKSNRTLRSVSGTRSASGRNFSGLASGLDDGDTNNLVASYATLAANVFAVTAAFTALQKAAQTEQLAKGLELVGARGGVALKLTATGLQEVTDYAISTAESMKVVAQATAAGFSGSEIERIGKVARGASVALGRDMADSIDRLTRGTIKLEPELLDEIGIMTRLDEAVRIYAQANNVAASSLTQSERRQAFLNAVLAEGERKFSDVSEQISANPYDKLSAQLKDLGTSFLNLVNGAVGPLLDIFIKFPALAMLPLMGVMMEAAGKIIPNLGGAYDKLGGKLDQLASRSKFLNIQLDDYVEHMRYAGSISTSAFKSENLGASGRLNLDDLNDSFNPNNTEFETDRLAQQKLIQQEINILTREDATLNANKISALNTINQELETNKKQHRDILVLTAKTNRDAAQGVILAKQRTRLAVIDDLFEVNDFSGVFKQGLVLPFTDAIEVMKDKTASLSTKFTAVGASAKTMGATIGNALFRAMPYIFAIIAAFEVARFVLDLFADKELKKIKENLKELAESAKETRRQFELMTDPGKSQTGLAFDAAITSLVELNKQLDIYINKKNKADSKPTKGNLKFGEVQSRADEMAWLSQVNNQAFLDNILGTDAVGKALQEQYQLIGLIDKKKQEELKTTLISLKTEEQKIDAIKRATDSVTAFSARYKDLNTAADEFKRTMMDAVPKDLEHSLTKPLKSFQDILTEIRGGLKNDKGIGEALTLAGPESLINLAKVLELNGANSTILIDIIPILQEIEKLEAQIAKHKESQYWGSNLVISLLEQEKARAEERAGATARENAEELAAQIAIAEESKRQTAILVANIALMQKENSLLLENLKLITEAKKKRRDAMLEAAKLGGTGSYDADTTARIELISKRESLKLAEQEYSMGIALLDKQLKVDKDQANEKLAGAKPADQPFYTAQLANIDRVYEAEKAQMVLKRDAAAQEVTLQQQLIKSLESGIISRTKALEIATKEMSLKKEALAIEGRIADLQLGNKKQTEINKLAKEGRTLSPEQERGFIVENLANQKTALAAQYKLAEIEHQFKVDQFNMDMEVAESMQLAARSILEANGDIKGVASVDSKLATLSTTKQSSTELFQKLSDLAGTEFRERLASLDLQIDFNTYTAFEAALRSLSSAAIKVNEDFDMLGQTALMPSRATDIFSSTVEAEGGLSKFSDDEIENIKRASMALAETQIVTDGLRNTFSILETGMQDAFTGIIDGTKDIKQAFGDLAISVLQSIAKMIAEMITFKLMKAALGGPLSFLTGAAGGVMPQAGAAGGITGLANGGIMSRSAGGLQGVVKQPTYLVGEGRYNEAVVPLPNGRAIPVQMHGGNSQSNNVQVNVNLSGTGSAQTETQGPDLNNLGSAIASAVQKELMAQKMPGGILNRYGAS